MNKSCICRTIFIHPGQAVFRNNVTMSARRVLKRKWSHGRAWTVILHMLSPITARLPATHFHTFIPKQKPLRRRVANPRKLASHGSRYKLVGGIHCVLPVTKKWQSEYMKPALSCKVIIGVRDGRAGGASTPPIFLGISLFGQKVSCYSGNDVTTVWWSDESIHPYG